MFVVDIDKAYTCIIVKKCGKRSNIGLIRLNRPKSMNALSRDLLVELCDALQMFKLDSSIGCVIITGCNAYFSGVLF